MSLSKPGRPGNGWPLAAPAASLLVVLFGLPVVAVAAMSFTDWQFGARRAAWIGLDNYLELARDPSLLKAASNTVLYALMVAPAVVGLGLAVALLIQARPRLRNMLQALHLLPYMATLAAMSVVWEALLHPTMGAANALLHLVGIHPVNWLREPRTVLPTLALIGVWENFGYAAVLTVAGLRAIPSEIYEAAELDGLTGTGARLWTLTLPLLAPTLAFVTLIVTVRALSVFDTVAVLTNGGPAQASEVLLHRVYQESFVYLRAGYGAALTVVFMIVVMLPTLTQAAIRKRLTSQ